MNIKKALSALTAAALSISCFAGMAVTAGAAESYTTVYQFGEGNGAATINIGEGTTGTVAPTSSVEAANAPNIDVDATKSGKLNNYGRGDTWAQINGNTILTLPGVPAEAQITFKLYGSTALTIGGTAYTNGQKYTAASNGDVVMTCTEEGYIATITVDGSAFITEEEPEGYTNTWYFGLSNGAETFALQRSAEYTYTVNDYSLVINTDSGKLNNSNREDKWSQCNDGTTFKIPAYAGAKLSWEGYNSGSTTGFKVDDVLYNKYYIADAEGTVNLSASGISYLSYIKVEPVKLYEITGTVSGASIADESIYLTASNGQIYSSEIASDGKFSLKVPADTYTPALGSAAAYVVTSPASVNVSASGDIGAITIAQASVQTATGAIANPPSESFTLTFTAESDASHTKSVSLEAGAASYSIELDPDTYTISSSVGALSPLSVESFKVVKDDVTHNIYYPETIPAATSQNITVDNTASVAANVYNTVSDAVAAAKAGNISAPVITLTSGQTYREQVIINYPNVTLKTSGKDKAKITWYYGIGYTYYSLDESGYYSKDRAMTRNSILMKDPSRWGASVLVQKNSSNFKAYNIVFENSFNQYYTTEEVADGVTPNGAQSITVDRQKQTVAVDSKAATERGAAIVFENSPTGCELYDCELIGSQDTINTSGSIYIKNCEITGNTDYIFGGGNVVFDNCDLIWGGYSDGSYGGHITANRNSGDDYYIFRDCTIKNGTVSGRTYAGGNLGRDWGGENTGVYFFNIKDETTNTSYAWTDMGKAVNAGAANLHIYDFDPTVNAKYNSTGATGANVNGTLTHSQAAALYEGVIGKLGFTPERITNAKTATEVVSSTADGNTVFGVKTEITAGSDIAVSALKWIVNNGTVSRIFNSEDAINETGSGKYGSAMPSITGGGTVSVLMMFYGDKDSSYNVVSVAE